MDREELETTYHALRSCRAVAEQYGVSAETVRRLLKRFGIQRTGWREPKRKAQRKLVTEDDIQQIIDAYKRKGTYKATAEELGWAAATVEKYVQLAGIATGARGKRMITDEQILEAVKIMTRQQIADKYNIKVKSLGKRLRKLGVHALKDDEPTSGQLKAIEKLQEINKKRAIIKDTWHFTERGAKFVESHQPGFELVELKGGRYRIRCKTCGNIVERAKSTIRQKHVRCDVCNPPHVRLKIDTTIIKRECVICGATFTCYAGSRKKTCCKECSRELDNSRVGLKRVPKGQLIDKDITLSRLFKRDCGKCYICGRDCDFNDWRTNKQGQRYPGASYPTIEHVMPLSRGGMHSWDNVRLACWECNVVKKRDGLIDVEALPHDVAITGKYFNVYKKKTGQYSLSGELIKVWESTAAIERALGFNAKHIQNVCRKAHTKTGNAYGYHWEYI